jgi:hypothetical protein
VWAEESRVTIRDCDIEGGWAGVRVEYGDVRVEDCRIRDCENGVWFFESQGLVSGCTITECINAIGLKNGSPRVIRNEIARNTVGLRATEHSSPVVGGTVATANRFHDNRFHVRNESYQKIGGYRSWDEQVLQLPGNWWGSDCPDTTKFMGDVVVKPWVDEALTRTLESCPTGSAAEGAGAK